MDLRRYCVLGFFLASILAACSSGNGYYFGDGGADGASPLEGESRTTTTDGGRKRDSATSKDAGDEEEDLDATTSNSDGSTKKDSSTTSDANTCTLVGATGNATCDACLQDNCCVEVNGCFGNSDCLALDSCFADCLELDASVQDMCLTACEAQHTSSVSKWNNAATCIDNSCSSECY